MIVYQSSNDTRWNTEYYNYGDPTVVTFVSLLIIVMIVALCGNILVLVTLALHSGMRTRTNLLLANLAVSDIIVVANIPFAINTLINGTWPFSKFLCILNTFSLCVGLLVSVHTLMWISVHKFISITRPFSKKVPTRKIFLVMMLIWLWSIIYSLTPVIIYRRGASQCGPIIPTTILQQSHGLMHVFLNQALPLVVTFYCYYYIIKEVRDNTKRLQEFPYVQNSRVQEKKITVTLIIVFACFLLCWSPYIFYANLKIYVGYEAVPDILNPIAYLFGYMNSACNPIIYALRIPSFRKAFEETIFGCMKTPETRYVNTIVLKKKDSCGNTTFLPKHFPH
ncbi:unnamed protein product [Meganyctiphanes norvegica]|uniref:G-protein coupled receptors family 1 profile domain-containing protein n=1 Tax=Meganyctiphanes norvegica TaxID=48144 RepID=A0AAV2RYI3_MEGNR